MDNFEYIDQPPPHRSIFSIIWNVLTFFTLLAVLCVAGVFLAIFTNPRTPINPFPPLVMPTGAALPTYTPTPRTILPATWTPVPTLPPTETHTPEPSPTSAPSETPFSIFTATGTVEQPPAPADSLPFVLGAGTPVETSSLAFHPEAACNWLGIAGQVFDLSGAPVSGQQVRIGGTLAGKAVDMLSLTGLTNAYGTAGFYEFTLGDTPLASNKTLWVQLLDQAGLPMSEKIYIETFDSCEKNLIVINFKQVR